MDQVLLGNQSSLTYDSHDLVKKTVLSIHVIFSLSSVLTSARTVYFPGGYGSVSRNQIAISRKPYHCLRDINFLLDLEDSLLQWALNVNL